MSGHIGDCATARDETMIGDMKGYRELFLIFFVSESVNANK